MEGAKHINCEIIGYPSPKLFSVDIIPVMTSKLQAAGYSFKKKDSMHCLLQIHRGHVYWLHTPNIEFLLPEFQG
jgi:hypothetical protein